ncbi:MAG: hypothetical protein IJ062_02220 [Firmicutes bacterium]|nr:hypothetical protein [Bacillota bacterium]
MYFYKSKGHKKPLFRADGRRIEINGKIYTAENIRSINVTASLGKVFPLKKYYDKIEMLVNMPHLHALTGRVEIETEDNKYVFERVYKAMEAFVFFRRIFPAAKAFYTFRNKTIAYRHKGSIDIDNLKVDRNHSVVFVLDKDNMPPQKYISDIKDAWIKECGFRHCKEDESGCFDEMLLFGDDDPWITIYDDSVEDNYIWGVKAQCSIYGTENKDKDVLLLSVYKGRTLVLCYGKNGKVEIYCCGDAEDIENLGCNEIEISNDYSKLELLKAEDTEYTFEQLFKNDFDMNRRLEELAHRFGINEYFVKAGYYDISVMKHSQFSEFSNGYKSVRYRIRLDADQIEGVYENVMQGAPAFDAVYSSGAIVPGERFEAVFQNVGNSSNGIAIALRGRTIHNAVSKGLASGNIPIKVKDLTISSWIFDRENETYICNKVKGETFCRMFFGSYAFVYENENIAITEGVVVNPKNIKTDADKAIAEMAADYASINVSFTLETPYDDDYELWMLPMGNVYSGGAKFNLKSERKK